MWTCTVCTFVHSAPNESEFLACKVCSTVRAVKVSAVSSPSKRKRRKTQAKLNTVLQSNAASSISSTGGENDSASTCSLENPKKLAKTCDSKRNIHEVLGCRKTSAFCPRPQVKVGEKWIEIDSDKLSDYAPLSLITEILPKDLANALLLELAQVIEWKKTTWNINGKSREVSRKTASINLDENVKLENTEFGADVEIAPGTFKAAAELILNAVKLHRREITWKPSYALANRYACGADFVGFHSDHLSELGPRPIIVGLSLGAARRFDLKRNIMTSKDTNAVHVYLPHNSALIMWGDCQENWKHAVLACSDSKIFRHKESGLVRYSLTFRMKRYDLPTLEKCYCGVEAGVKSKDGKYFLFCKPYNKEKCCHFWKPCEWAEKEAAAIRSPENDESTVTSVTIFEK